MALHVAARELQLANAGSDTSISDGPRRRAKVSGRDQSQLVCVIRRFYPFRVRSRGNISRHSGHMKASGYVLRDSAKASLSLAVGVTSSRFIHPNVASANIALNPRQTLARKIRSPGPGTVCGRLDTVFMLDGHGRSSLHGPVPHSPTHTVCPRSPLAKVRKRRAVRARLYIGGGVNDREIGAVDKYGQSRNRQPRCLLASWELA